MYPHYTLYSDSQPCRFADLTNGHLFGAFSTALQSSASRRRQRHRSIWIRPAVRPVPREARSTSLAAAEEKVSYMYAKWGFKPDLPGIPQVLREKFKEEP